MAADHDEELALDYMSLIYDSQLRASEFPDSSEMPWRHEALPRTCVVI